MDETGTTIIPSPFKRGDFVQCEGDLLQIISCTGQEITYKARNIEDNKLFNITLPVMAPPTHQKVEEDYFQITDLNEDKEATLKAWSGGGTERRMKVRWDEDVELIRDGLLMEDKEVFCTVGALMGKEVMGDTKYKDKDPPILKMPDLVMDIIFSKLTFEDRLNSRLVRRRWGIDLLPIKKFVTCTSLRLRNESEFADNINVCVRFSARPNFVKEFPYSRSFFMKDLHPLIKASLLDNVEEFLLERKSILEDELQAVFEQCQKINDFEFSAQLGEEEDETDPDDRDWVWSKKLISDTKQQLKFLRISTYLKKLDLREDVEVENCTTLQSLDINMDRRHSVLLNLQCLPSSINSLSILRVAVPFTRSQILWIATNLPNLTDLMLDVHHVHSNSDRSDEDMDMDEIDRDTVLNLVNALPFLKYADLFLGPFIKDDNDCCRKGKELKDHVSNDLEREWQCTISFQSTFGDERLEVMKQGEEDEDGE